MDVSNVPDELNDPKVKNSLISFSTNSPENINSTVSPSYIGTEKEEIVCNPTKRNYKMHHVIIAIIVALFSFIVVYCLFMQIWWVLGVLAIPLLRKAMLKIIDHYV